jgi:hypothetical protein
MTYIKLFTHVYIYNRLFIGNFQVPILKKWIDNDPSENDNQQLDDTLPRSSTESIYLSTMRRRT